MVLKSRQIIQGLILALKYFLLITGHSKSPDKVGDRKAEVKLGLRVTEIRNSRRL